MGSHPVTRLFEPRDSLPRAAGETNQVTYPPNQRCFQHAGKIGGHLNRAACGPCDGANQLLALCTPGRPAWVYPIGVHPFRARSIGAFYHISGSTQPYSPARQLPGEVRDQRTVGTDDKSEHLLLRQAFARNHAAAHWPCFRLFVGRVNLWQTNL
jgi:hypothetical protein